jgi:predicted PurR-regulated permease PerM
LATGLLEIVPLLGPAASAVLVGLFAIEQASSAWSIVAYALYATALRISIDQFFGPIVLGKAAYVRPVLVIFCFLAGGYLFGVIGVLLAVPAALALKVVLGQHYREGVSGRP